LTNALTDAVTNLPNARAFFLVLENHIASRSVPRTATSTILAIDIKNFGEHNRRFGHANGDRLLLLAADKIKINCGRWIFWRVRETTNSSPCCRPLRFEIAREL
jgi:diguanylate cyclase (GGDEF)-like protein